MQHFIGIVPPEPVRLKILSFQRSLAGNTFPELVEPHVTVKAQSGLTDGMEWLERVKQTAATVRPFELKLGAPGSFGRSVAFLSVESGGILPLHERLLEAVDPAEELRARYFERPGEFHFHLTLATSASGLTEEALDEALSRASRELGGLPPFEVAFIRVYRQENADGPYAPHEDIRLG